MIQPPLNDLQKRIRDLLLANPHGLDIREVRNLLQLEAGDQAELNKRIRELRQYYTVPTHRDGRRFLYTLGELKDPSLWGGKGVSNTQRARILNRDGRRCQMCGRTPAEDKVKLHVDHKIPRAWGGKSEDENLWTLCSDCNEGKRDHFESLDAEVMSEVLEMGSVHARLAHLLKANKGNWVDSGLLEFAANFKTYQADWPKRIRELRYLGLDIETSRRTDEHRVLSLYRLNNWVDLPEDPSRAVREYEQDRARRNRAKRAKPRGTGNA